MSITFLLFHGFGMILFLFGLLILVIYMAKYMKKEMLFKYSVLALVFGIVFCALGWMAFVRLAGDDAWNMMGRYGFRGYMMNWYDDDYFRSTTTTNVDSSTQGEAETGLTQ